MYLYNKQIVGTWVHVKGINETKGIDHPWFVLLKCPTMKRLRSKTPLHTCFLHQCQTFHDKWNKHNRALKWAYWLGSVHPIHRNTVHHHQKRINRQDTAIGCSAGDGLFQLPRLGCISRDSNTRRHHRQMKALAWPDPEILSLGMSPVQTHATQA